MLPVTKPNFEDLEVTLIGPGYGECIILHYGGEWLVVDSCRHLSKIPAAIFYLQSLGVSLEDVRLVACTHWHDDHAAGLSDVYSAAINAQLVISAALKTSEFFELLQAYQSEGADGITSGIDEIRKTFDIAHSRGVVPIFARSDQIIWRSQNHLAELHSLSPCDRMIFDSFKALGRLLPKTWGQKDPISPADNHVSVAMVFKAGNHSVLLGSDLEEHGIAHHGWSAVVSGNRRPQYRSSLYKVAHHGSSTGEHEGIWTELLGNSPTSILTPFSKLKDPLPRSADRERIKSRSGEALLTTDVLVKRMKRVGSAGKLLAKHDIRILNPQIGAIRCRVNSTDPKAKWVVEKSSEAIFL